MADPGRLQRAGARHRRPTAWAPRPRSRALLGRLDTIGQRPRRDVRRRRRLPRRPAGVLPRLRGRWPASTRRAWRRSWPASRRRATRSAARSSAARRPSIPGVMAADAFDLAGFCVGFVERDELIDRTEAQAGDAIIGLASSGSSCQRLLAGAQADRPGLDQARPTSADGGQRTARRCSRRRGCTRRRSWLCSACSACQGLRSGGLAHITGGGLAGNLPRAVGDDLGVRVRIAIVAPAGHLRHDRPAGRHRRRGDARDLQLRHRLCRGAGGGRRAAGDRAAGRARDRGVADRRGPDRRRARRQALRGGA